MQQGSITCCRPAYLALKDLREDFPGSPFLACTATATKRVKDSIIESLGLKSPVILESSFNSESLFPVLGGTMKSDIKGANGHIDIQGFLPCLSLAFTVVHGAPGESVHGSCTLSMCTAAAVQGPTSAMKCGTRGS